MVAHDTELEPLGPLRILVVEDDFLLAKTLETTLAGLGCEVLGPAPRVDVALEYLRSGAIDGAILDISLKGGDVFPVASELMRRKVPVILSTGHDADRIPAPYHQLPRVDKPFDMRYLVQVMRETFSPAPG